MASFFFKAHLQYKERSVFFSVLLLTSFFLQHFILEHNHGRFSRWCFVVCNCWIYLLTHVTMPLSDSRSTLFFIFLRNFQRFPKKTRYRHSCFASTLNKLGSNVFYRSLHRLTLKRRLFIALVFRAIFFPRF